MTLPPYGTVFFCDFSILVFVLLCGYIWFFFVCKFLAVSAKHQCQFVCVVVLMLYITLPGFYNEQPPILGDCIHFFLLIILFFQESLLLNELPLPLLKNAHLLHTSKEIFEFLFSFFLFYVHFVITCDQIYWHWKVFNFY